MNSWTDKIKALGPGLLYAGAAIGVSHLVQSTQAGAKYGFLFVAVIVIVHAVKYPFFVLGPRFAQREGMHLAEGFAGLGRWALALLIALTLFTMFSLQAAVTVVTAGLAQLLTGWEAPAWLWSAILLALCLIILRFGDYNLLDRGMKVLMIILALSTAAAFVGSFFFDGQMSGTPLAFSWENTDDVSFLIGFLGWMPAPLEIALWHSLWTMAKQRQMGATEPITGDFDFKVGFYGAGILAILFLVLGANVLYGSGVELSQTAGGFAVQLVDLYTTTLGSWARPAILVAAFTTMFSTTLACLDATPRLMAACIGLWKGHEAMGENVGAKRSAVPGEGEALGTSEAPVGREALEGDRERSERRNYLLWTLILSLVAVFILRFFIENMAEMVRLATVAAFLAAPALAWLSIRVVRKNSSSNLWSTWELRLAYLGLIFFSFLALFYLTRLLV